MNSNSNEKVQSTSPLNKFLTRFDGVKETPSGHQALCPVHDDTQQSVSIKAENRRVLIKCHAGCDTEAIVTALGLEMSDLFADDVDPSWKPWEGTEVAVYTYKDAAGNPRFQVVRYEIRDPTHPAFGEKKFLQRRYEPDHPDAGEKGCPEGYVWGLQDVDRVLYDLPTVLSAVENAEIVWIVEGEKDVLTLKDRGMVATCIPGGAFTGNDLEKKLPAGIIAPLEGADVVVIPDNDEPGYQFARAVGTRLFETVKRVRIAELPDVPKGGDVTDYLENGHTADDLRDLVAETEPFEPPPETVDELVDRAREEEDPTVVYDHIRILAEASEAEYQQARGKIKEATGINLNGLESARQEAIDQIDEEKRREEWEEVDAGDLPAIRLGDDRPSRVVVSESIDAYEDFNDPPSQFSRGQEPVRLTTNEEDHPVFESIDEPLFDAFLSQTADFVRMTENGIKYVDLPLRLVRQIRQLVDLPSVKGIRELPFLRPDGTVVRTPGYDEDTKILYVPHPQVETPDVPKAPSEDELRRAVEVLMKPLQDFPFVDEASRANALAAAFTPIVRPLLDKANFPLVIFDATKQGTGKTLLADVVTLMGTGRLPATMNAPSGDEEWRKQITSQLRKGESIVVVDNIKGRISSEALERALTQQSWGDRLLGHSKQLKLPSDALWIATGNNLRPRGEMTRRCILVRMDAEMVHPWKRTGFEHPNLREWVRSNRGRLVAALLTAVRAWSKAGAPRAEVETLGSFTRWSRAIGGLLKHLGIGGFLENLDDLYETASGEEHRWGQLLRALYEWSLEDDAPTPFTAKQLGADLRDHAEGLIGAESEEMEAIRDELPEDVHERLRYGQPMARSLGKMFEYREGRRFPGGWYIERVRRDREGVHWIVQCDDPDAGDRDSVTLDSPGPEGDHTPTSEEEEGGGGESQEGADPKSQTHNFEDDAPF